MLKSLVSCLLRKRSKRGCQCSVKCLKGKELRYEQLEERQLLSISPQIVDNQDSQHYQESGSWATWNDTNAYQQDFRYHAAGNGSNTASWTLDGLQTTGQSYQLFATWTAESNRPTNSPFTVFDGTTSLATVRLNQQFAPVDQTIDSHAWQSIGTYSTQTGTLTIQLSNDANGYVIADAVCAIEVETPTTAPTVIDNGDAAFSEQGTNWLGWSETGAYQSDFRYHAPGTGQNTTTWTFPNLNESATYQVYATWSRIEPGNELTVYDVRWYDLPRNRAVESAIRTGQCHLRWPRVGEPGNIPDFQRLAHGESLG